MNLTTFKEEAYKEASKRPSYIRYGQSIHNWFTVKYGNIFNGELNEDFDCFYKDESVEGFLDNAFEVIKSKLNVLSKYLSSEIIEFKILDEILNYFKCENEYEYLVIAEDGFIRSFHNTKSASVIGVEDSIKINDNWINDLIKIIESGKIGKTFDEFSESNINDSYSRYYKSKDWYEEIFIFPRLCEIYSKIRDSIHDKGIDPCDKDATMSEAESFTEFPMTTALWGDRFTDVALCYRSFDNPDYYMSGKVDFDVS